MPYFGQLPICMLLSISNRSRPLACGHFKIVMFTDYKLKKDKDILLFSQNEIYEENILAGFLNGAGKEASLQRC